MVETKRLYLDPMHPRCNAKGPHGRIKAAVLRNAFKWGYDHIPEDYIKLHIQLIKDMNQYVKPVVFQMRKDDIF